MKGLREGLVGQAGCATDGDSIWRISSGVLRQIRSSVKPTEYAGLEASSWGESAYLIRDWRVLGAREGEEEK